MAPGRAVCRLECRNGVIVTKTGNPGKHAGLKIIESVALASVCIIDVGKQGGAGGDPIGT